MRLSTGFEKVGGAAGVAKDLLSKATAVGSKVVQEAPGVAKATFKGMQEGAAKSVSHHLGLKGFGDAAKHIEQAGGLSKAVGSSKGRRSLGQAIGKAMPSAVAAGAYGAAGKKMYDATLGDAPQTQTQSMYNYYGQ
jgi:hypothetical protein